MISKIKTLLRMLLAGNLKYMLSKSLIITKEGSVIKISKGFKMSNSKITISRGGSLQIGDNCSVKNVVMIINGHVSIGNNNTIENGSNVKRPLIMIEKGSFTLGSNNIIRSDINVRFNGSLKIGDYNVINDETEIRADELVTIGDFNQISYKCNIWDTNTHNIYSDEKRRELTIKSFPIIGYETEKPSTAPIIIGSDCWIGKEAAILKGVTINNSSVVGFKTLLTNCTIEPNTVAVSSSNILKFERKFRN